MIRAGIDIGGISTDFTIWWGGEEVDTTIGTFKVPSSPPNIDEAALDRYPTHPVLRAASSVINTHTG